MNAESDANDVVARIQRALAGSDDPDPDLARAIDELFAAHQDRIYGACRRLVGDAEQARDLAQETLLVAWRRLPEYRGESLFSTWLCGIARNVCFNAIRKRVDALTEDGVIEGEDPHASALRGLERHEREELLRAAAQTLEPIEQEAVYLRYVEQIPQERITDLLEIEQASGARGILQRCRRRLEREIRARLAAMGHGTSFLRGST